MSEKNGNGEANITLPWFQVSASGSLMVMLIAIVGGAALCYFELTRIEESVARMILNQRVIVAYVYEFGCMNSLDMKDRQKAIEEDWCHKFVDRRLSEVIEPLPDKKFPIIQ